MLPAIKKDIMPRPGDLSGGFDVCSVPKEGDLWEEVYNHLRRSLRSPIIAGTTDAIDPYFGYFGYRFHPVNLRPRYFHIGIDIMAEKNTAVYPVTQGVLEYAGFSALNGNYVLLSHPNIQTEDGYTLYSMYIHLETVNIRFTTIEKIIRELGGRRLTTKIITSDKSIGTVGATGNVRGLVPHLHLQLEFRDRERSIIAIDPARALGLSSGENLTKSLQSSQEFKGFYKQHRKNLTRWEGLWDKEI